MFSDTDRRLTETGLRSRCPARHTVADGGSGDWVGPAADGRQFDRHTNVRAVCQMAVASAGPYASPHLAPDR